ncbi:MAG: CHAD domain-containing protein [Acidobacteriota bacterium]
MRESVSLWKTKAHSLERARKALKRGDPEGLHDLRVALRRLDATARALQRRGVAKKAKSIVRSLSEQRQLEVDRELLTRIGRLGFLSPDAVTALAARWEKLAARGSRRVARAADGRPIHALHRSVARLTRKDAKTSVARLERARRRAQEALSQPLEGRDDRTLHRYRIAVKKARYLAEDLAALGVREWTSHVAREKKLQEALGRWNDLRMFCQRLAQSRDEAEERGAEQLAAELERLLASLEATVAAVRKSAVDASRLAAPVAPGPAAVRAKAAPRRPARARQRS